MHRDGRRLAEYSEAMNDDRNCGTLVSWISGSERGPEVDVGIGVFTLLVYSGDDCRYLRGRLIMAQKIACFLSASQSQILSFHGNAVLALISLPCPRNHRELPLMKLFEESYPSPHHVLWPWSCVNTNVQKLAV